MKANANVYILTNYQDGDIYREYAIDRISMENVVYRLNYVPEKSIVFVASHSGPSGLKEIHGDKFDLRGFSGFFQYIKDKSASEEIFEGTMRMLNKLKI
tara:strand:+ start:1479 stop:1775 length:297 start_codon:yes stop_codon:yes gene_type:complete